MLKVRLSWFDLLFFHQPCMPSSSLQAVWVYMVFNHLHFQVGTWKVITERFHAVSTLIREPYDFITPTPMKRHGKRASFQTFSRLFQRVHSFKSWEIKLKMKKEYRFLSLERYSKMSSSQENLKLVIYFYVVVLQGRQRNLLKSVAHV